MLLLLLIAFFLSLIVGAIADILITYMLENVLCYSVSGLEHFFIFFSISSVAVLFTYFKTRYDLRKAKPTEDKSTKKVSEGKMKVVLDKGAKMPTRAHEGDAGLDLYAREPAVIPARGNQRFDTGVHIELPPGTTGFLKSKSGLNVNFGITSDGVIDSGYTGSIVVKLYNNSDTPYEVKAGDKISQLVILPVQLPSCVLVDALDITDRGGNGFGSSGR